MNLLLRNLEFIMNERKGKGKSHKLQGLGFPKLEPSSGDIRPLLIGGGKD